MKLQWIEGEHLSGWRVQLADLQECRALETISSYMSGWGQHMDESVAQALGAESVEAGKRIVLYEAADVTRVAALVAAQQAARAAKRAAVQMVRCACGHTVARTAVMSASLGTSCPDCYDEMSG